MTVSLKGTVIGRLVAALLVLPCGPVSSDIAHTISQQSDAVTVARCASQLAMLQDGSEGQQDKAVEEHYCTKVRCLGDGAYGLMLASIMRAKYYALSMSVERLHARRQCPVRCLTHFTLVLHL